MPSIQQLCCYISLTNNKEYYLSIERKWLGQAGKKLSLFKLIFVQENVYKRKTMYWTNFILILKRFRKGFTYIKMPQILKYYLFLAILVNDESLVIELYYRHHRYLWLTAKHCMWLWTVLNKQGSKGQMHSRNSHIFKESNTQIQRL